MQKIEEIPIKPQNDAEKKKICMEFKKLDYKTVESSNVIFLVINPSNNFILIGRMVGRINDTPSAVSRWTCFSEGWGRPSSGLCCEASETSSTSNDLGND